MSYWVHVEADGRSWQDATAFEPPLPGPEPGRGFARYFVEIEARQLVFASLAELEECVRVLGIKPLPTSTQLSRARHANRRGPAPGPNSHWLSRLPAHLKSGRKRERVLKYLTETLEEHRRRLPRP